jgi:hypothetical protein
VQEADSMLIAGRERHQRPYCPAKAGAELVIGMRSAVMSTIKKPAKMCRLFYGL